MEVFPPPVGIADFSSTEQFRMAYREWFDEQKRLTEIDGIHRTCRTGNYLKRKECKRMFYEWRLTILENWMSEVYRIYGPVDDYTTRRTQQAIKHSRWKLETLYAKR